MIYRHTNQQNTHVPVSEPVAGLQLAVALAVLFFVSQSQVMSMCCSNVVVIGGCYCHLTRGVPFHLFGLFESNFTEIFKLPKLLKLVERHNSAAEGCVS
jgi:hypothetical protein